MSTAKIHSSVWRDTVDLRERHGPLTVTQRLR